MAPRLLLGVGMRARTHEPKDFEVALVATNPETLDGLQAYLRAAGLSARCVREIETCFRHSGAGPTAFVIFPDDFAWESVTAALDDGDKHRQDALRIVVTAQPKRLESRGQSEHVVIVPRPAWGWTILDAIRAYADRRRGSKTRADGGIP